MKKIQFIITVLTSILFFGCAVGDLLPQSNTISIINKSLAPSVEKKLAVIIEDTTYTKLRSIIDRNKYQEDEKKYFSEALNNSGITNYQFVSKNVATDADYLMTITVEDWLVRRYEQGKNNEQTASLIVTLADNKSKKHISQLAGKAHHISRYYNINKFMGNLLEDILKDMYKSHE